MRKNQKKNQKISVVKKAAPLIVSLTHQELRSPLAVPAIMKIKRSTYPSMRTVKKVVGISKALTETMKASQDSFVGLVKAYAKLDDKGEVIESEDGSFDVPEEKQAEWRASCATFMTSSTTLELPQGKLTLDEVAQVGLTPEDLEAVPFLVE